MVRHPGFAYLSVWELRAIEATGIQYADGFTMLRLLDLCLNTGIAPEKISEMYWWAENMILQVHAEEVEAISFIRQIREADVAREDLY